MTSEQNRIIYLDITRIVAVFSVVLLHVAAKLWYLSIDDGGSIWFISVFWDSAVRFCVPVLFMVSGVLFLDPTKPMSLSRLYKKYILRIVLVFAVWSLVYAAIWHFLSLSANKSVGDVMRKVLYGEYHLWFLYAIAGLYIITPILRKISADKSTLRYFLILSFIFGILIPILQLFPGFSQTIPMSRNAHLEFLFGYPFYYLLGYYFHAYSTFNKKALCFIYAGGIAGFALTFFGTLWAHWSGVLSDESFFKYLTPNVCLEALAMFVFIKHVCKKGNERFAKSQNLSFVKTEAGGRGVPFSRAIGTISKRTFGIYLIHVIFIMLLEYLGAFGWGSISAVFAPVIAVAVFLLSYCATALLARIPKINRYLV